MDACDFCGTKFKRHYRRGGIRQRWCSKSCSIKGSRVPRKCETCGKDYSTTKLEVGPRLRYCSVACIERYPCLFCGEIIKGRVRFFNADKRFCSRKCANIAHKSMTAKKKYVVIGFAERVRSHGSLSCERCEIDDYRVLIVHHRDRDHSNIDRSNLCVLCYNCHHVEHWKDAIVRKRSVGIAMLIGERVRSDPSLLFRMLGEKDWENTVLAEEARRRLRRNKDLAALDVHDVVSSSTGTGRESSTAATVAAARSPAGRR